MSDEQPAEQGHGDRPDAEVDAGVEADGDVEDGAGRDEGDAGDEGGRHRRQDRRSLIDLTRVERGEPERRRLPGVERRATPVDEDERPADR